MDTITTKDGTQIYYNEWGKGQPVVFSHGWPLSSEAFEDPMFFRVSHGCRCIAHDRRGHGRSSQPRHGNGLDTYADDLAALAEQLDLQNATLKVYNDAPHGMCTTHEDPVHADLPAFLKRADQAAASRTTGLPGRTGPTGSLECQRGFPQCP
jgi:alpha-beta hydrolase superfamily lysophospholipase